MRVILFGTGKIAERFLSMFRGESAKIVQILAFTDNAPEKQRIGNFHDYPIISPSVISSQDYDAIVLCLNKSNSEEVTKQLLSIGIPEKKILSLEELRTKLFIKKNQDSDDPATGEILKYLEEHELTCFNGFIQDKYHTYSKALFDEESDFPYIFYKTDLGKQVKLFYPKDMIFPTIDGEKYVLDILYEQSPGSPHLYTYGDHKPKQGDVIADVGVCEGNFALRFADIASEIFLFEADEKWIEPLKMTFCSGHFNAKVHIVNGYVDEGTEVGHISLDQAINKPVDFLKMDIEGAEVSALKGAKRLLKSGSTKCSICSYHQHGDEKKIVDLLNEFGYQTKSSKGGMTYIYGDDFYEFLDVRRGIVYAEKSF